MCRNTRTRLTVSLPFKCLFGHEKMSLIYMSVAMTLSDCGQFTKALDYYNRELQLTIFLGCLTFSAIAAALLYAVITSSMSLPAFSLAWAMAHHAEYSYSTRYVHT